MSIPPALRNTPYIAAQEIAARLGIQESSVRTQMRAMRNRRRSPVDMRVPDDLAPADLGRTIALYWRDDVETWMQNRAARRARRAAQDAQ